MKSIKVALAHRSNGQGTNEGKVIVTNQNYNTGNQSRSMNTFYTEFSFQHDTLVTEFKIWIPFYETIHGTDNPDIMEYIGYTSLKFNYFLQKHMFTLMGRGNIETGNGAVEATYSYPLIKDTYFYTKAFTGYGESLIDYNNYVTKFSIGFSFSR
ncbi:phospholipase A [Sulfurimonas sp.]|uniref:phospholipase A n=1 Tax=Sulfurimonas sp. TaxID=2022749 RepID=UPI002AB1DBC2|nr:phospholipase A [Sulfurimonas sp.]